jgi:hypothetical protein
LNFQAFFFIFKGMRGRPKEQHLEDKPTIFQREYLDKDGVNNIWKYNLNINESGPISVEMIYPKRYNVSTKEEELDQMYKNAPLTQRKYITEEGKLVGYGRAQTLGLVN